MANVNKLCFSLGDIMELNNRTVSRYTHNHLPIPWMDTEVNANYATLMGVDPWKWTAGYDEITKTNFDHNFVDPENPKQIALKQYAREHPFQVSVREYEHHYIDHSLENYHLILSHDVWPRKKAPYFNKLSREYLQKKERNKFRLAQEQFEWYNMESLRQGHSMFIIF